jgi:thioredoxin-like negative regulator of GroEL
MKITKTIDKMMNQKMKTLQIMFHPSNIIKLIALVILLIALFYIYRTYFKEGMTDSCETTPSKFEDDVLNGSGKKLVVFYADWCGHCKKIKPLWDDAASTVNKDDRNTWKMWKINVGGDTSPNDATDEQNSLAKKYNVKGYPTIYMFENGQLVSEYEGPRTKDGFISFLS